MSRSITDCSMVKSLSKRAISIPIEDADNVWHITNSA
jgi:hypothetical protein